MFSSTNYTNKPTCNLCFRQFSSKSNLNSHLKLHSGLKEHKCGKSFIHKHQLDVHIRTHIDDSDRLFACNRCDYKSNKADTYVCESRHQQMLFLLILLFLKSEKKT